MVTVGLAAVGAAGYVFLALSGHRLPAEDAAAVASFYLIVSIAGPGMFTGLEQQTSRSASAHGQLAVVARHAALVGGGLLAIALAVLAAVGPLIADRVLGGRWELLAAVAFAVVAAAGAYVIRGLLGGARRFATYAATLVVEGVARILLCTAIVLSGVPDASLYAAAFGLGTVIAVAVGLSALRDVAAAVPSVADPAHLRSMARGAVLLLACGLGFQVVANLAPLVVAAASAIDPGTAAAFASASVLVRIPVIFFVAVQSVLLPTLTRAAADGAVAVVRATLLRFAGIVAAIGAVTVGAAITVGPDAVHLLFGGHTRLSGWLVGLLAVGTVPLLLTQVLMPALLALGEHRAVTAAWLSGGTVLVALLAVLPTDPMTTAALAQIAGGVTVAIVMGVRLVRPRRS